MRVSTKILILTSLVSLASCKKCKKENEQITPVEEESPAADNFSSTTPGYVKFTLGGVDYAYTGTAFWFSGTHTSTAQMPYSYYSQSNTYNSTSKTTVFLLTKSDTTTQAPVVSDAYFRNFIKVQNYLYASTLNLNGAKGMNIRVKDNANIYWYSINPVNSTSFQVGSGFNIIKKVEFVEVAPNLTIKFKATFNCKLYNAAGDSIMLTNGETITSYSNT